MIPFDKLREECGIFGIAHHPEASRITYLGLYALQHRGQESAGMVSLAGGEMHREIGMGYVAEVFRPDKLARLPGSSAIGHVRYSTAGESHLVNAQPILLRSWRGPLAVAHNGNLINAAELRSKLEHEGAIFHTTSDTEVIFHLASRSRTEDTTEAIIESLHQVQGAYSLLILTRNRLIAARDPHGFRPLCIGRLNGALVLSSETCAFDLIGATAERELEPGEVLELRDGQERSFFPFPADRPHQCVFEHVYFARPDSVVFGRSVNASRDALGRQLAHESHIEADVVVPVPDSGVAAAIGYAAESGIPLQFGLIRNHYVGRTFIEPQQSIRDFSVKVKLNPVREILTGRRVILVDDSIVRGTTSQKIIKMVREAGAREVHLAISSPPIVSPCYYGIDTPRRKELIAATEEVESIRCFIGADSLHYLSLKGMVEACGDPESARYCTSCFTGNYPHRGLSARARIAPSLEGET
jgi:amidophosphoribosyltransferase